MNLLKKVKAKLISAFLACSDINCCSWVQLEVYH